VAAVAAADAPVRRRHLIRVRSLRPSVLRRRPSIRRAAGHVLLELPGLQFITVIRCRLPVVSAVSTRDVRRRSDAWNVHVLDVVLENVLSINCVVTLTTTMTSCAPVSTHLDLDQQQLVSNGNTEK